MDPRERKQILGQWGVRDPNIREARESERLRRDLEGSPVQGQRLPVRARNFRPSVDSYVVSRGGPLPYMQRLAEIDRLTDLLEKGLRDEWQQLAAALRDQAQKFSAAWQRAAEGWRYRELNELIDRHNTYFPVEARLPMDVRRRDYALINGKPYERPRVGAAWALERFPPELDAAWPSRAARAEAAGLR